VTSPISYATFYGYVSLILMLFCAAQAPELLGRDQRYQVLSLYFSRALVRTDYAVAKLGALVAAMLLVFLVPELVIFLGHVLSASDVPKALVDNVSSVPPVLVMAVATALVLGGISLAVAAFTPRRAYATAAIIAIFIVPPIIASIVVEVAPGDVSRWIVLLVPSSILDGLNAYLFNVTANGRLLQQVNVPGPDFAVAAVAVSVASVAILIHRYRRIAA
jgi:ABC-2 type transport system permease protein